jgi:DNA polymerase III epsilon subunit family exonuclease
MAERYIVFDVETPNSRNDRMSAIGVTVVEGGEIVQEIGSLIDPEAWFDPFNIALTGITPGMAAEAPTFEELWPVLEPVFSDGLLVAHNAPFDMGVLAKCLRAYGICWRQTADYACTVRMGRRCYPYLENHRLSTLCAHLDIELAHHRAESDSRACAELLLDYLGHGLDIKRFRRTYDLCCCRTLQGPGKGKVR